MAALRLAHALAALGAAATLALAGCSESRTGTTLEIFREAPAPADGSAQKSGECSSTADYIAHIQHTAGRLDVTVTYGDGRSETFTYTTAQADPREISGAAGAWTLDATWTGFQGAFHAQLDC